MTLRIPSVVRLLPTIWHGPNHRGHGRIIFPFDDVRIDGLKSKIMTDTSVREQFVCESTRGSARELRMPWSLQVEISQIKGLQPQRLFFQASEKNTPPKSIPLVVPTLVGGGFYRPIILSNGLMQRAIIVTNPPPEKIEQDPQLGKSFDLLMFRTELFEIIKRGLTSSLTSPFQKNDLDMDKLFATIEELEDDELNKLMATITELRTYWPPMAHSDLLLTSICEACHNHLKSRNEKSL